MEVSAVKMKYMSTLISVKDMENSKKFYHDVLGLNVVADFGANVTLDGGVVLQTLKGDAEVPVQQVVHVDEVLLDLRLVQAVLGLHVRADFRQDHLFVGKRIARDGLHQDERRRQDDPQRQDGDQQTLDDVFDHGNLLSPFACKLLISNSRDSALSGPPERRP